MPMGGNPQIRAGIPKKERNYMNTPFAASPPRRNLLPEEGPGTSPGLLLTAANHMNIYLEVTTLQRRGFRLPL